MTAFTCAPGIGSEPDVGWHWATEVAKLGHEVVVLTDTHFKDVLDREVAAGRVPSNITLDVFSPRWLEHVRDAGVRLGFHFATWHFTHLVWQFAALRRAKKLYRNAGFDFVHHVTYAMIRHPTVMGRLGLPLVLGPLGGGGRVPSHLRGSFSRMARILEFARDLNTWALRFEPITLAAFRDAMLIFLRDNDSLRAVPARFHAKTSILFGIGTGTPDDASVRARGASEPLRLIFAGRLLHLKGMHLGLRALAAARKRGADVTLTLAGDGTERAEFEKLVGELGLGDAVTFLGRIPQSDLFERYRQHHALLFPSLRDAAGLAVLEAMARGLAVIALKLGGPGQIVTGTCGRLVDVDGRDEEQVVASLTDEIVALERDETLRSGLAAGAIARAREHTWEGMVTAAYSEIELCLAKRRVVTTKAARPVATTQPAAQGLGSRGK